MATEKRALFERWFEEVWNKGNVAALPELLTEDAVIHGLPIAPGEGQTAHTGMRALVERFRGAFPDIRIVVEDAVEEGDKIAVRCVVRGTHLGETLGVASSRKPVEITGMTIARVCDGKIVEGWNNYDFMTLFQQIGAMQPPAAGWRLKSRRSGVPQSRGFHRQVACRPQQPTSCPTPP